MVKAMIDAMDEEQFLAYLAGAMDTSGHVHREKYTSGPNKGRYHHVIFVARTGRRELWQPVFERAARDFGGRARFDMPGMEPRWQARKVNWYVDSFPGRPESGDTRTIAKRLAPYSARFHDLFLVMAEDETTN